MKTTRAVLGASSTGCVSTAYFCLSHQYSEPFSELTLLLVQLDLTSCIALAEPAEAAVLSYPPPPGAPTTTPSTQDTSPPPSDNQAMQQSTRYGRPAHVISCAAVRMDESEQSSHAAALVAALAARTKSGLDAGQRRLPAPVPLQALSCKAATWKPLTGTLKKLYRFR